MWRICKLLETPENKKWVLNLSCLLFFIYSWSEDGKLEIVNLKQFKVIPFATAHMFCSSFVGNYFKASSDIIAVAMTTGQLHKSYL